MENKNKVLIIEDDIFLNEILKKHLSHLNYEVKSVHNNLHEIEKAKKEDFNLIILDTDMPDVNIYNTARNIKGSSDAPLIIISATSQDYTTQKSLNYGGATEFLSKPVNLNELTNKIEYHLSH